MTDKLRYAYDDEGFFVDMHRSAPAEDVLGTELLPGEVVDLLNALEQRVELLQAELKAEIESRTRWAKAWKKSEQRVEGLSKSLAELKELLGPGSGYHIAPDDPPGEFIEGIRIESIFERADKALASEEEA